MNREERALAVERAVFWFVTERPNSQIVSQTTLAALIRHGGMSVDQVRKHCLISVCTLGLWLPVFWFLAMREAPRLTLIYSDYDGVVLTWEIDSL